jgi:hypothetical protein
MNFNFEEDLKKELHCGFDSFGIRLSYRNSLTEFLLDYLTIAKKIIRSRRRKVDISPSLQSELATHAKQKEILHLKDELSVGKNVNYFQNKKLFQTKFHDHLVYEWNIFHFHLSFEKERKSKFVKQVKQLLFVYIEDKRAIFLGTNNHTEATFADTKWIEILHEHFPETISKYRDDTITKIYPELTPVERQGLWDKGYLLGMTNVNGTVYHNPGIGRATSGHSVIVTKQVNEILRWLWETNAVFKEKYENICKAIGKTPFECKFQLQFGPETMFIIELNSNNIVLTYPERLREDI